MDASQTTWISLTKFLSVVFASLFIATAHPKTVHSLFPKWLQVVYKPITGCDFWFLGVAPPYNKTLKAEEVVGGGIRSLCLSDSGHSGIFLQTLSKTLWLDFAITRRIVSAARTSLLRFFSLLSFPLYLCSGRVFRPPSQPYRFPVVWIVVAWPAIVLKAPILPPQSISRTLSSQLNRLRFSV